MKPFRNRLTIIMMLLSGISMLGAGFSMAEIFKQSHISLQEETMVREIKLIKAIMVFPELEKEEIADYYSETSQQLEKIAGSRVTFIDRNGSVLGDSESSASEMENHRSREELQQADKEGIGRSIRHSQTMDQDMIYVAVPVKQGSFDGYIRLAMNMHKIDEGVQQGWMTMGLGLVILFVVATLVSYRISASLTSPIEKITRVARRITHLDYDARVRLHRKDEIGQLAHAINAMADSLQTQLRTIRDNEDLLQSVLNNMTGGIVMLNHEGMIVLINRAAESILGVKGDQITGKSYRELRQHFELTKLMEEGLEHRHNFREERSLYYPVESIILMDGVSMLQDDGTYRGMLFHLQDVTSIRRLERMRSEFVANVSHELKTPLAAVKGFAETLLVGGVDDPKTARSFVQIIYDESERLNRLIRDILELSKIESKRAAMEYSPVHLSAFFDSLIEFMLPEAEKKKIQMKSSVPEELFIEADEDKLRQIFTNLLSNAINYTQEGGSVELTVRDKHHPDHGEVVEFTVKDSGIGIPKKDLPRIFERFYRVDKARSRSSGGTGLGLSIVKHLVEKHHGSIRVESELGMGSSFIIELPLLQEND